MESSGCAARHVLVQLYHSQSAQELTDKYTYSSKSLDLRILFIVRNSK
jgi:hypothetical protein